MVYRLTLANILPLIMAQRLQFAGLSGTVSASIGAGSWGIEEGTTVEFAGIEKVKVTQFASALLQEFHEQAAYLVELPEAVPVLLYDDDHIETLG